MRELWTDAELLAAVGAYAEMMRFDQEGTTYSKRVIRDRLLGGELVARSAGSFERRMANISSVLAAENQDWLSGYKPLSHVGTGVRQRLRPFLEAEGLM